ncbi:MAG: alpha/beta fold hydrolase [Acidimicrobiia bacterium]
MHHISAADGTPIGYEVWGRRDGEPLLLIQGLGVDARGWTMQRLAMGRRFRCYAVHNRGVGATSAAEPPYSLFQMADDAVTVLNAEGVESAHVMGASMGGVISQIIGVLHPERTRSLVLACTASRHHEWRIELLREWREAVATSGMSALAGDGLRWLVGPRVHRRFGLWLNLIGRLILKSDPRGFVAQVDAILAMSDDLRDRLHEIRVPTLVITGSQDSLTPVGDAEEMAELISAAELDVVSGAGHAVMAEAATAYNRAVVDFLRRATGEDDAASRHRAAAS